MGARGRRRWPGRLDRSGPVYHQVMDVAGYVQAFNEAVESGQWDRVLEYFSDEATMTFEGPSIEPMTGRAAIRLAYSQNPPTDTIELAGEVVEDGGVLVAPFRWTANGEPGTMRFETTDNLITWLMITFG